MIPHPTEHDEQSALMDWCNLSRGIYPELELLFAIPNGGNRKAVTGAMLKAEGVKKGVPDLFFPVPTAEYAGLFIEMKRVSVKPSRGGAKGGVTSEQSWWISKLREQDYAVAVCYGMKDAVKAITDYLDECFT